LVYESLVAKLGEAFRDVADRGLPLSLLDIGAGDGAFVEPSLAYGCRVTATEMSRPSIDELNRRYGANPAFTAVFDEDGSVSVLGNRRFAIILCASVLHHIPDYMQELETAISRHLERGGAIVTFQDPLWYPSVGRRTRLLNDVAYLSWRLSQGDYVRGFRSRMRRMRHAYDENNPSDMVEYHVVRNGLDHEKIRAMLSAKFETVSLFAYWSTPSAFWQRIGDWIGAKTTFGLVALGYTG
jgi:SAM-dependent methyltransferase